MNIEYFIAELKKMEPSEALMIQEGFTGLPNSIMRNYDLEKKEPSMKKEERNVLYVLFNEYDLQFLRFQDFSFDKNISEINGINKFCSSSGTFLGFQYDHDEVVEYDFEELSIVNYCAKNIDSFLASLLKVFELQSLRLQGLVVMDDEKTNNSFFEKCVSEAGGVRYSNFFKNIIY